MTTVSFRINLWLGLAGLVLAIISIYLTNIWMISLSALVCLSGLVHVYFQLKKEELKSTLLFNRGVRHFNRQRYKTAENYFRKSQEINPENELAKYGLYKISLYK
jgi:uncharacterized protein HemY